MSVLKQHILRLPPELVSAIAGMLHFQDIAALASTCRQFKELYDSSQTLRHIVELGIDGLVSAASDHPLSLASQHALLLERRSAWAQLRPVYTEYHETTNESHSFDLAGDVWAYYTPTGTPQLMLHWLSARTGPAHVVEVPELDILVRELVFDPAQDLIVFLEGFRKPTGEPFEGEIRGSDVDGMLQVHLRALSAHGCSPHERAAQPILQYNGQDAFVNDIDLYLAGTSLGAVFSCLEWELCIWDWTSGTLLYSIDAPDSRAADLFSFTFEFLSPSAFVLAGSDETDHAFALYLFQIGSAPEEKRAVRLLLPSPGKWRSLSCVLARTGSFSAPEPARRLWVADPAARVHVFLLQTQPESEEFDDGPDPSAMLVVHTATLLGHLERARGTDEEIEWDKWGPGFTRIIEYGKDAWLNERAVAGSRITFSTGRFRGLRVHYILDFNVHRPIPDADEDEVVDVDDDYISLVDARRFVGRAQSAEALGMHILPGGGLCQWTDGRAAAQQLPYVCTRLTAAQFATVDQVLLDGDHIMRREVSSETTLDTTIYTF